MPSKKKTKMKMKSNMKVQYAAIAIRVDPRETSCVILYEKGDEIENSVSDNDIDEIVSAIVDNIIASESFPDPPTRGIWVWEGYIDIDDDTGDEEYQTKNFRPATRNEWLLMKDGKSPFDDENDEDDEDDEDDGEDKVDLGPLQKVAVALRCDQGNSGVILYEKGETIQENVESFNNNSVVEQLLAINEHPDLPEYSGESPESSAQGIWIWEGHICDGEYYVTLWRPATDAEWLRIMDGRSPFEDETSETTPTKELEIVQWRDVGGTKL